MKTLYLVRHAKSSWKFSELTDLERPLNKRGKRDAPYMGNLMYEKKILVDAMICSPAQRTLSTALSFAKAMKHPTEKIVLAPEIYEVLADSILETIQKRFNDNWQQVMLFGHNYACTEFANWYAKPILDNVPTCGVVAIDYNIERWNKANKRNGRVRFFEYPKKCSNILHVFSGAIVWLCDF